MKKLTLSMISELYTMGLEPIKTVTLDWLLEIERVFRRDIEAMEHYPDYDWTQIRSLMNTELKKQYERCYGISFVWPIEAATAKRELDYQRYKVLYDVYKNKYGLDDIIKFLAKELDLDEETSRHFLYCIMGEDMQFQRKGTKKNWCCED